MSWPSRETRGPDERFRSWGRETGGPDERFRSQGGEARAQFAALAQLRWRLFRNAFRRKGEAGELAARILFMPILGVIAAGPLLGAGFAAYYIVSSERLELLAALTWSIFLLWQIVSINISAPALSFDINILLRFPISFPRYLAARLFFGLLSTSNVIGTLALISADIGIGVARRGLLPWATLLFALFAIANILFTRMIFAWVDRWLSTRRARELLTAFILFASLGFQYLNVTFNPGLQTGPHHANHLPLFLNVLHHVQPIATILPPGLAAASILASSQSHLFAAFASLLGLIAFAALFLAVYAWRMQREFRGENLSELTQKIPATQTVWRRAFTHLGAPFMRSHRMSGSSRVSANRSVSTLSATTTDSQTNTGAGDTSGFYPQPKEAVISIEVAGVPNEHIGSSRWEVADSPIVRYGVERSPHSGFARSFHGTFSPTLLPCLQKELLYLRRNTNQLFGFLAPIFMVFLFAGRIGASGNLGSLVFPAAVAYSILGVSILSYNCLGMDGAGVQFYFLAPMRLGEIFLAKNLLSFFLILIELVLIYFVIASTGRAPSSLITVATVCWLLFTAFTNGAVGNLRSITAPKKIDLSKISRKQTSQLSALIALGVVAGCFGIGCAAVLLAKFLHLPWLMIPILLALAAAAFVFYLHLLNRLDSIAGARRESLIEELSKP